MDGCPLVSLMQIEYILINWCQKSRGQSLANPASWLFIVSVCLFLWNSFCFVFSLSVTFYSTHVEIMSYQLLIKQFFSINFFSIKYPSIYLTIWLFHTCILMSTGSLGSAWASPSCWMAEPPVHFRTTHRGKQALELTYTATDNLEFPLDLTCMFLDVGRKLKNPERQTKGEHFNSTQNDPIPGVKPTTSLLWGSSPHLLSGWKWSQQPSRLCLKWEQPKHPWNIQGLHSVSEISK